MQNQVEIVNRCQKITFLQNELLRWANIHKREFPWRQQNLSAYQYIIAEILLQRTKADTINDFYPIFLLRYPTWESIANSAQTDIAQFLRPIGLYNQRSIRLKKLAHEMLLLNSIIPKERKDIEKLSFMGQYIVNAILLFIHNIPAPLLDVNMARILERYFGKRKLADIRYDNYLQELAHDIVNHPNAKNLNYAVLDFAAIVCKPKPNCSDCPLSSECYFFNTHSK